MNKPRQESVTIETLNLLRKTVDYLNRLPVVPTTRSLCREIEAHLADSNVIAAHREAMEADRLATRRVARSFTPAGQVRIEVEVCGTEVTVTTPEVWFRPGVQDKLLDYLRKGVTLKLDKWSDYPRQTPRPAKDVRPATYGEVMKPLDVEALPEDLLDLYKSNPLFREWVHLHESVHRAEKISSWTEWTAEQGEAYQSGDYAGFSRLRGYTEGEIEDFQRFVALTEKLDIDQKDENFSHAASWAINQLVSTPRLWDIEAELAVISGLARETKSRTTGGGLAKDQSHE